MAEKRVLARMFFRSGHTETRPLSWIQFISAADFSKYEPDLKQNFTEKIKTDEDEVYIAITDQLMGVQLFQGVFVNARLERKSHYQR